MPNTVGAIQGDTRRAWVRAGDGDVVRVDPEIVAMERHVAIAEQLILRLVSDRMV